MLPALYRLGRPSFPQVVPKLGRNDDMEGSACAPHVKPGYKPERLDRGQWSLGTLLTSMV